MKRHALSQQDLDDLLMEYSAELIERKGLSHLLALVSKACDKRADYMFEKYSGRRAEQQFDRWSKAADSIDRLIKGLGRI